MNTIELLLLPEEQCGTLKRTREYALGNIVKIVQKTDWYATILEFQSDKVHCFHISCDYRDCGLCCVYSVLCRAWQGRGLPVTRARLRAIEDCVPQRSLWTIELVLLLFENGIKDLCFTTSCVGVNSEYKSCLDFYASGTDEETIEKAFDVARSKGVSIQKMAIEDGKLESILLLGEHLVIILLDKVVLDVAPEEVTLGSYIGHYVLLYGYDAHREVFYAKDPATSDEYDEIPRDVLHAARKRFGTDDDVIFMRIES